MGNQRYSLPIAHCLLPIAPTGFADKKSGFADERPIKPLCKLH